MTIFFNPAGPLTLPADVWQVADLSAGVNGIQNDIPQVLREGVVRFSQDADTTLTRISHQMVASPGSASGVDYFRLGIAPWHGLVHVTPKRIDLGNLLSSQVREIFVWNAQRYDTVNVTGIVNNAGAGLTISSVPLPTILAEVSDIKFELTISSDGDSSISGTIDIVTSSGTLSISVEGRRVVAWHFIPQDPVQELMLFDTGIMTVGDGTEYRDARRDAPVTQFNFNHRKRDDGKSSALMQNILFDWISRVFGVPRWWEQHRITNPLLLGTTVIPVNPDFCYFRNGGLLLLMENELDKFEVAEIDTIQPGTSITLKAPTIKSYAVGSAVVPMQLAVCDPSVNQRLFTIGADDTTISFKSIDDTPVLPVAYDNTYNGLPIFDDDNIITRGNTYTRRYANTFKRTDFGGLPFTFDKTDRGIMTTEKNFFTAQSREIMWKRRSWMHALKGSQGVFYLSTFRNDFAVNSVIGAGATNIDVLNVGYSNFVRGRSPRAAVEVVTTTGDVYRREISSAAAIDDTVERISISTPIGVEISVDQVKKISILWLCRIADDKVTFLHEGVGNGLMGFKVRSVRA